MNRPFSEYIIQYLVDDGVLQWAPDGPADWLAIVGIMPENDDNQDNFVSVLDTSPALDGVNLATGHSIQHPTFQIFVRSADYSAGLKKGKETEASLTFANMSSVTVESDEAIIQAVQVKTGTAFLKQLEKNERQVFVLNVQATMWEV